MHFASRDPRNGNETFHGSLTGKNTRFKNSRVRMITSPKLPRLMCICEDIESKHWIYFCLDISYVKLGALCYAVF
jgi:hypothetical protein